jgi:hypothetical protein
LTPEAPQPVTPGIRVCAWAGAAAPARVAAAITAASAAPAIF